MKEVEVKAKLPNRKEVMTKLRTLGCRFEKPVTQNDTVYTEFVGSRADYAKNEYVLRIRARSDGKHFFTFKKRTKNSLDAIEHETAIGSRSEMEKALLMMGFKRAVVIRKTRVITHYRGCEICIDHVASLGSFIEMERLVKAGDAEKIQAELFDFLVSLGVRPEGRVFSGYDILMLEAQSSKHDA